MERRHQLTSRPSAQAASSSVELIAEGVATAVHDVSDGGLFVAIAEMALAADLGAEVGTLGERTTVASSGSVKTRGATL